MDKLRSTSLAVLQRATIQGTSLNLCVVCDEVFRYEVDFNFSFPTRFRFIFFPYFGCYVYWVYE